MLRVFVPNKDLQPMMPCHLARARKLLKNGRARVYRRYPFTIVILDREAFETQDVELKLDPGSKITGIAVVGNFNRGSELLWAANLEHRGLQVRESLQRRRALRRSRRSRKLRYRPARFQNRRRPEGWLPPSLLSRVDNVKVWGERLTRYTPVASVHVETVRFDTQEIQNPEISGVEYQQGELAGYEVREYLLEKFNRTCVYCGSRNVPLEIEHLVPRSRGGSDRVSNLALACTPCNQRKGNQTAEEFGYPHLMDEAKKPLRDAAAINAIRYRIGETLKSFGLPIHFWSGGRTKMNRIKQGYPKDHWIDAACVGENGDDVQLSPIASVLHIKATGRGSRQMCLMDRYGFPRTKAKRVKRIHGFQTGDMARLNQPKGKYKGVWEGKVSVRERGYFDILTSSGARITASWKNFMLLQRFDGYAYSLRRLSSSVH
ncbi:MAG: RNA-guided endonuclease IscB [Limnochordia bacterium]|jgi:5-methylcytosine-specific restriction endonuclease McrA